MSFTVSTILSTVAGRQADRKGIDAGELLEEHRLAFHHGEGRLGPDVAEAEDRRAVGDHRHGVLLDRQRERPLAVVANGEADARDARGVGHREVVAGADRDLVLDLDLPAEVQQEGPVGDVDHAHAGKPAEPIHDLLAVLAVARLDREIAYDPVAARLDEVHGADVTAGSADCARHPPEHTGLVGNLKPNRQAVRRTGENRHHRTVLAFTLSRRTPSNR
jgi:hypothetical protein